MVVAGPNARKDFHYNETEELFYQLEGSITIITQENGERNVLELHAGDMYLHPASTPSPTFRGFNRLGY
jgi:3-hydroxyanthranilate 3,4-dioxygenase